MRTPRLPYLAAFLIILFFFFLGGCQAASSDSAGSTQSKPRQMTTTTAGLPIPPESLAVPYCPECEMKFPPHLITDTLTYAGKLYGFCSPECKASFAKRMGLPTQ